MPVRRFRKTRSAVVCAAAAVACVASSCGSEQSKFPEAQAGKVVEFFDPAKADIGFDPERQYVSAAAVGKDGTLFIGIAERRTKEGSQNIDAGRLFAVPPSGKPKEISEGTVSALAVSSDGTLYIASTGSLRSSLSFFRNGKKKHITDYTKGSRSTLLRSGKGGAGLDAARALALGRDDLLYVANVDGKAVITRSRAGKVIRIGPYGPADGAPDSAPGLTDVKRMTVDSSTGDVYLADEHKIDRLGADGKLTTIAGARRAYEAKLEPVPNTFSIGSGPETGPATTFRFQFLQGIAFVPDTGDLYAIDAGRLVRIDRQGTLTVLPRADLSVSGALAYDPRRKKLYTGAKSLVTGNSGIARIDLTGEALILSGSDSASSVTDQLAVDSRGNAYYLFNGTDDITVIGDLLSETRIDLKKRPA